MLVGYHVGYNVGHNVGYNAGGDGCGSDGDCFFLVDVCASRSGYSSSSGMSTRRR